MTKSAGFSQLLTVLALLVAPVGSYLTYKGTEDLLILSATVFSVAWLSFTVLVFYRKSTMERVRTQGDSPVAESPE